MRLFRIIINSKKYLLIKLKSLSLSIKLNIKVMEATNGIERKVINGVEYVKNVKLINALGLITSYDLINLIEYNIFGIPEIKLALEKAIVEAKQKIDVASALLEENKDFDFDGYYERSYEQACETWSCFGLDLEKLS